MVDGEGGLGEMERVIAISVMGVKAKGGSIFSPNLKKGLSPEGLAEFRESWIEWLRQSFQQHLGKTFVEVYMASTEMRIRRITNLDRNLDQSLSAEASNRSQRAGSWFLEGKSEMQRAPQWKKYADCVCRGECPGHVITVFALQSALYHLPLLSALTAYVYFEWRVAMGIVMEESDLPKKELSLRWFQQEYPESMGILREVFDGGAGFGGAISAL